jgi:hypothetical protein
MLSPPRNNKVRHISISKNSLCDSGMCDTLLHLPPWAEERVLVDDLDAGLVLHVHGVHWASPSIPRYATSKGSGGTNEPLHSVLRCGETAAAVILDCYVFRG